MNTKSRVTIFLASFVGLATVFILTGLFGVMSVQAQPPAMEPSYHVVFTDTASIPISDLSGNIVGEGTHLGALMCKTSNCSQKIEIDFDITLVFTDLYHLEYKFTSRQEHDPDEKRLIVGGKGSLTTDHMKERFSFTAIFEDNRDGTVDATYNASRPDASFRVTSPGSFAIESRSK